MIPAKAVFVKGFSFYNLYNLTKELETLNEENLTTIVCTEWAFISMFNNNPVFGEHKVVIHDEGIERVRKDLMFDKSENFMMVLPLDDDDYYGILKY